MREILFRGKRIDTGSWKEGYYLCLHSNEEDLHFIVDNDGEYHRVKSETIGEFTGLTDKNGKKIFEGDIVRYNDTLHKVVFCTINGCAFFGITYPDRGEVWNFDGITCAHKMKIIGNIYDNPELFGGDADDQP